MLLDQSTDGYVIHRQSKLLRNDPLLGFNRVKIADWTVVVVLITSLLVGWIVSAMMSAALKGWKDWNDWFDMVGDGRWWHPDAPILRCSY